MRKNSSWLISPSPSRSASSIISWSSSSVKFSPSSLQTLFKFLNEMRPVSSSSNSLKALTISSLESFSDYFPICFRLIVDRNALGKGEKSTILTVINSRKSLKSMIPFPALSTLAAIFLSSSFWGSKPRARIATLSSLTSIVPVPSTSKRSKASRISCFCSGVKSWDECCCLGFADDDFPTALSPGPLAR
jgi:hypothetical protein